MKLLTTEEKEWAVYLSKTKQKDETIVFWKVVGGLVLQVLVMGIAIYGIAYLAR